MKNQTVSDHCYKEFCLNPETNEFPYIIMTCNKICIKFQEKTLSSRNGGNYSLGHKLCSFCEVFINWKGKNCPCCGTSLRNKPRNSKARKKILESLD